MMCRRSKWVTPLAAIGTMLLAAGICWAQQPWTNAQLLNPSSRAQQDVKGARVVASTDGGFHAVYVADGRVRYRRYNTSLGSEITVNNDLTFNADIDEGINGDLHIVWEDWGSGGPEVGWVRSTNGGSSFSSATRLSNSSGQAKHPQIAGYGNGSSDDALMSYWNANTHDMRYSFFNGSSWNGDNDMGTNGNSQYEVTGMDRDPTDGSVWRSYDNGPWTGIQNYDGSWGSFINLDPDGFTPRICCTVNDSGQVMVILDQEDTLYSYVYTPGAGATPKTFVTDDQSWGHAVCNVPGTNDFYLVYGRNDYGRLFGRRHAGGGWLSEEQVSYGLSDDFTVGPDVSADPDGSGTLYAVWEWWGNGYDKPQQYYSVRAGSTGPRGTLAGTVYDQNSNPVAGATITVPNTATTVTQSNGTYSFSVPTGTYSVTASKNYYNSQTIGSITINEDQTTNQNFSITGTAPSPVSNPATRGYDQKIRLTWSNSGDGNHTHTMIRYRTDTYPTSITDGTLVASITSDNTGYTHTGLSNGSTYYYTLFAYYDDASNHYAGGVSVSGSPVAAPKTNLLANGGIDSIVNDVAQYWTAYSVNDPNNGAYFLEDYTNYMTSPSQSVLRLEHTSLPVTGLTSKGLYQVINNTTSGKVYFYTAYQDIWNSDYSAAGQRYCLNFGINPSGGTSLGTQHFDGTIDNVKWMTSDQALYNHNAGSPVRYGGFHKSWAAFPATGSSISVWSGVTIDNTAAKDAYTTRWNTDLAWVFEFDMPANQGLQNGNFEGSVIDLQNVDGDFNGGDTIPSSWIPAGGSIGQWSNILTEVWGARSGALGVRLGNRRGTINGGLMQKIACTNGYYQQFTAYALTSGQDNTVGAVGIDPTGGADINSSNIVWTTTSSASWTELTVGATAQGSAITVFLRSYSTTAGTGGYHYTYFDDCSYSQQSSAPTPGSISGTVTDSCGTPIASATVTAGTYSTTTAGNGTYLLDDVTPATYTVTASKSGYTNVNQTNVTVSSGTNTTVNLQFYNNKGAIEGMVTDSCGVALGGIQICWGTSCTTTGSDGYYYLDALTAGTNDLVASEEGYLDSTEEDVVVSACNVTLVDFELSPSNLEEKLSNGDFEDGFFTFWGGDMPNDWGATFRGSYDSAAWDDVNWGGDHGHVLRMESLASGFEAGVTQRITGLTPGNRFVFTAEAYHTDQGTNVWIAVDPEGGTSLPTRTTSFDNITGQWNTQTIEGTVGSNGAVTVFLWAYKQWGVGGQVNFDNASLMVEGLGSQTGTIFGVVDDDAGNPIDGATVSITGGQSATTGADGSYTINSVAAGTYDITAQADGHNSQTQTSVNVSACYATEVNFALEPVGSSSEVLDNGDMEGGFWATGWGGGSVIPNDWDGWYNPGDANNYAEGTIVHGGSYSTRFYISAGGDSSTGGYKRGIYQNVNVGANKAFTITVWARHTNGNCPSIMAWNPGSDQNNPHTAYQNDRYTWVTTDNWGEVGTWVSNTLTGTAPAGGYITVIVGGAHYGGGGAGSIYIDDVSVVSEVAVSTTGTISGSVTDSSGSALQGATVATTTGGYSTTTDANGNYSLVSVEAGTYSVTASKTGYVSSTENNVSVTAGQTTPVSFSLSAQQNPVAVLDNGSMEGGFWATGWGGGSAIPNDWDGWYNPGDANCFDNTTIKHAGSHSALVTIAAGGDSGSGGYKRGIYQNVYVGANTGFTFTVYAYHTNGNCPSIMCWNEGQDNNNPADAYGTARYQWVTTDNWNQVSSWVSRSMTGTAPSSGWITVIVGGAHHGGGGVGYVYIDDVSVTTP